MPFRCLQGRVIIREDYKAEHAHKLIIVPDISDANDKHAQARKREFHRGVVLAMGPPATTRKGHEVPPGFGVGDSVIFHWNHLEASWTFEWLDGERACCVPQQCVDAVVSA